MMAEYSFQEVMKQWMRICNSVPGKHTFKNLCLDEQSGYVCPMRDCGLCNRPVSCQTDDDRLQGEQIIMQWAAEHPELIYPTWREWFLQTCQVPLTSDLKYNDWETTLNSHIPADIAQKLGLKPKEG